MKKKNFSSVFAYKQNGKWGVRHLCEKNLIIQPIYDEFYNLRTLEKKHPQLYNIFYLKLKASIYTDNHLYSFVIIKNNNTYAVNRDFKLIKID